MKYFPDTLDRNIQTLTDTLLAILAESGNTGRRSKMDILLAVLTLQQDTLKIIADRSVSATIYSEAVKWHNSVLTLKENLEKELWQDSCGKHKKSRSTIPTKKR